MIGIKTVRFERHFAEDHEKLGRREHRFRVERPIIERDPRARGIHVGVHRPTDEVPALQSSELEDLSFASVREELTLESLGHRGTVLTHERGDQDAEPLRVSGSGDHEQSVADESRPVERWVERRLKGIEENTGRSTPYASPSGWNRPVPRNTKASTSLASDSAPV